MRCDLWCLPCGVCCLTNLLPLSVCFLCFQVKDTLQLLQVEAQRAAKQALVNKHWARPRFLQYDYLYHYMHNYYDDVIDYLDRRMRGYEVETLKPQTWAERALRTYTRNTYPNSVTYKYETTARLIRIYIGLVSKKLTRYNILRY